MSVNPNVAQPLFQTKAYDHTIIHLIVKLPNSFLLGMELLFCRNGRAVPNLYPHTACYIGERIVDLIGSNLKYALSTKGQKYNRTLLSWVLGPGLDIPSQTSQSGHAGHSIFVLLGHSIFCPYPPYHLPLHCKK